MTDWFDGLEYTAQAFLACLFTYGITAAGAAVVFFFKEINKNIMDAMLGFAAGVMVAASYLSLLAPAAEMAESLGMTVWAVAAGGFMCGGLLLFAGDRVYEYCDSKAQTGTQKRMKRAAMLMFSITLHNIPEGLAVGVAFGSLAYGLDGATPAAAALLAFGIGLQNFPEGTAVSVPLRREGLSRGRAFFMGQLSGLVEPVAAVLGAALVLRVRYVLPFLLTFAAGAMIYVVVEELIPESQTNEKKDLMALFTLVGFSVMMILDIALG